MPTKELQPRPPVVVVMGHIDHGKSTLLDFIRSSNIVDKEAGGITQHLSAYEVLHTDEHKKIRKITFLDTPGHEAFSHMRDRGAKVADIAILVVSAEDSVKQQTLEALQTILDAKIPYVVAINKIDKPGANVEKVKMDLSEKGVYLEGYGGDIAYAEISAKAGTNISHLLDLILIVADLGELTYDPAIPAQGIVIESHRDKKRGISATILIKDGTLKKGMFVVAENASATTRIFENFLGKIIPEATACEPVAITGFDELPRVGSLFYSYANKKEAEQAVASFTDKSNSTFPTQSDSNIKRIPLIVRTDVSGTAEAILQEIEKLNKETISFKIISRGVGSISHNDIQLAAGDKDAIVIGFNVKMDADARDLNEKMQIPVHTFEVIYKLSDFLSEEIEKRRPREEKIEVSGSVKILKVFSQTKDRQVVGGRVTDGRIISGAPVRIMRRDFQIGQATIVGLEQGKIKAKEVLAETECGILVESKFEIAGGDVLEAFTTTSV